MALFVWLPDACDFSRGLFTLKSKRARLCCEHISTREEGEIMSVTVSDLLKLPSLQQARVIGGAGGLKKVVSSISVLESTDQIGRAHV